MAADVSSSQAATAPPGVSEHPMCPPVQRLLPSCAGACLSCSLYPGSACIQRVAAAGS